MSGRWRLPLRFIALGYLLLLIVLLSLWADGSESGLIASNA